MTGRLGDIITYVLNDKLVSRTIGQNNTPPTELQLAVLSIAPLINNFMQPVKEFVRLGFDLQAKLKHTYFTNEVYSYTFKNAIKGTYPNYEIDYTKVLFSKGLMPITDEVGVVSMPNGLEFTWNPVLTDLWRWSDVVMLMAYIPELREAHYYITGARRQQGTDFLVLPKFPHPVLVHTYVSFITVDHRSISDSVYTGAILREGSTFNSNL